MQRMIDILKSRQKTIIIIAHRLNTVFHADKIIVLHQGNVIEEGVHDELMNNQGHYYELWKQQFPMIEEFSRNPKLV